MRASHRTDDGWPTQGAGRIWLTLVTLSHVRHDIAPARGQPNLWTANGITKVRDDVPVRLAPLREVCRPPVVMRDSPDAITKGARCVDHWYAIHWPEGSTERYFALPAGMAVHLSVDHYIPSLDVDMLPIPAAMSAGSGSFFWVRKRTVLGTATVSPLRPREPRWSILRPVLPRRDVCPMRNRRKLELGSRAKKDVVTFGQRRHRCGTCFCMAGRTPIASFARTQACGGSKAADDWRSLCSNPLVA